MRIEAKNIAKELIIANGKIVEQTLFNKITNSQISYCGKEFEISYYLPSKKSKKILSLIDSTMMEIVEENENSLVFSATKDEIVWHVELCYFADEKSGVVKKTIKLSVDNYATKIDYICLDEMPVDKKTYNWTIPQVKDRVYIPNRIFTLGQPYYVGDMFFGGEFPTAENRIVAGVGSSKYYFGRTFEEIAVDGVFETISFVIGGAIGNTFEKLRASFFEYTQSFAQPKKFRIQFNSWYDHMLDINRENIQKSFVDVHDGFAKAGLRPLDCYVVDDGWTDYKQAKLWEFDQTRFPGGFGEESKLTKSLGSTFGVWFGPRGGYTTQTAKYAKALSKIGYPMSKTTQDICTGSPKYIKDLCDRMASFCVDYNVTYFKIDGFAAKPCASANHGHPKGEGDGIYFYTFLWEEWTKGLEHIRSVQPDVFLNITSYAHCSPWFLRWANAVWLNNCGDMNYEGAGSDIDQCLNYRDGKYKDFFETRQIQFPVSYLYNHEPCYGEKNYNPPLPNATHKTVVYTNAEFEKYMYMCMMRGTGFVELYFSPQMFDDERWKVATKVLQWAEKNFDIISNSQFFGSSPKDGGVYGYYAKNGKNAIVIARNSATSAKEFMLDNASLSFDKAGYTIQEFYPTAGEKTKIASKGRFKTMLESQEVKIFSITIDK
ncbi:MAG: hypothetical protein RSD04_03575 [Clostridia bacterium]